MSKILVTGSNGQVGRSLKKLAKGNFVFTTKEELNISDENAVASFLKEGQFDFVINCTAYTAVDMAEEEKTSCLSVNVDAVEHLARHCKLTDCTFIHISSDYVYHPGDQVPIDEDDPCTPKGFYASSKYLGEEKIRESVAKYLILRTSWVYSEYGHNFVKTMLRLAESRDQLNIVDDQIGSPTYAGDLAEAILKIVEGKVTYGTYNYSNLGFISWADFAQEIFNQSKKSVKVNRIPSAEYPTPSPRPLNSRLIKSKIADDFGIPLYHWKQSLAKCLKEIDN
jgi:dTDP-4-dehydrorhamnose reductase